METNQSAAKNEQQNNPLAGNNPTDRNFQRTGAENTNEQGAGTNEQEPDTDKADTDPELTEQDLEDNNLSVEDADKVEWEAPKQNEAGGDTKNVSE